MSAIIGCIDFEGRSIVEATFRKAVAAIQHYGPDRTGSYVSGPVAFAHHFLEVGRLRKPEQQPYRLGPLIIVADALLDYRSELAEKLGVASSEAKFLSDSALIARGFLKFGRGVVNHLYGDFAIAIYDTRNRTIFLARDHIGARPLFYSIRGGFLYFCTDIRGIISFGDGTWDINDSSVAHYLFDPTVPRETTFFSSVLRVKPGTSVQISADGSQQEQWWKPEQKSALILKDKGEYADFIAEVVSRAISERLETDHPVGSHLSGGMDSSAISLLASEKLRSRGRQLTAAYSWAPALTAEFPDLGPNDERRNIEIISKKGEFPCRFNTADTLTCLNFLERGIELDGTADVFDEIPVTRQVSDDGVRVLLSGWGGDEALSNHGEGYLSYLLRSGAFLSAARLARIRTGRHRSKRKALSHLWTWGILPFMPHEIYRFFDPYSYVYPNRAFASSDLIATHVNTSQEKRRRIRISPGPKAFYQRLLMHGHISERMETWAAWSASKSFQYRYPFTDRVLIDALFSLPIDVLFGGNQRRGFAKQVFGDLLPGGLHKYDQSTQLRREHSYLGTWKTLHKNVNRGLFGGRCDWLNMAMLKKSLIATPAHLNAEEIGRFAEIMVSVRVWNLYQRHRA